MSRNLENMTKQQEIREGIETCIRAVRNDRTPQVEALFKAATDNILKYLHSQGAVLETKTKTYSGSPDVLDRISTGIIEPLIEEG